MKGRCHLGDLDIRVDGSIIENEDVIGFSLLRTRCSCVTGLSWVAERLLAYQVGLFPLEGNLTVHVPPPPTLVVGAGWCLELLTSRLRFIPRLLLVSKY